MTNLYRIWYFTQNDRREAARVLANEDLDIEEFLLHVFIEKEFQDKEDMEFMSNVYMDGYGLMWNQFTPKECLENVAKCDKCAFLNRTDMFNEFCDKNLDQTKSDECTEYNLDPEYNPCEFCDGCTCGFNAEKIENPNGESFEFKTIYGTNEFYDLTTQESKCLLATIQHSEQTYSKEQTQAFWEQLAKLSKSEDWDTRLSKAWKESPELGISALLLSSATPKEAISKDLLEKAKRDMEKLENEQ